MPDKEINDILTGYTKGNSYQSSISRMVNDFLVSSISPWLTSCFEKYSEDYFHSQMKQGFSFVDDWKRNHPDKFKRFVSMANKPLIKRFVKINEIEIVRRVELIFEKKGWTLYENEKRTILASIAQFKEEIDL